MRQDWECIHFCPKKKNDLVCSLEARRSGATMIVTKPFWRVWRASLYLSRQDLRLANTTIRRNNDTIAMSPKTIEATG